MKIIRDVEDDQDGQDILEYFRRDIGTDQWTAFPKSFAKLMLELFNRGPFVFLSGDVHYSYAMYGRSTFPPASKLGTAPLILHAVSSPFRSQWTNAEVKKNDPEICIATKAKPSAVQASDPAYVMHSSSRTRSPSSVQWGRKRNGPTLITLALFRFGRIERL